jgi:hypothetical protein
MMCRVCQLVLLQGKQAEAADRELQAKAIEKRKADETRRLIEQFGSSGGRGGSRGW